MFPLLCCNSLIPHYCFGGVADALSYSAWGVSVCSSIFCDNLLSRVFCESMNLRLFSTALTAVSWARALITPMHEPTIAQTGLSEGMEQAARRWCDDYSVQLPFQLPGLSSQRVSGQDFDLARAAFEARPDQADNDLSHSVPRMLRRWADRAATCEGEHCGHSDAKVEGPTLRWLNQACSGARAARGEGAARIAVPVLLLNGGQDTVVEAAAQQTFCAHVNAAGGSAEASAAGRCVAYTLPQARHSVLVESDAYRQPALAHTLAFFDCVRRGGGSVCR
jgi:lysophospholipase